MAGPRQLILATGNPGKLRELRELLDGCGWELLTATELGIAVPTVIETGRSYMENAVAKAVAYARAAGIPALADDSGVEVDALDGRPGVLSARYGGGANGDDRARVDQLLRELVGVAPAHRGARFRCVVAFNRPGNRAIVREGLLEGRVALAPRGESGFGYDPVFELPDGRTVAELGDEKQRISHRAQAVTAMREVLQAQ